MGRAGGQSPRSAGRAKCVQGWSGAVSKAVPPPEAGEDSPSRQRAGWVLFREAQSHLHLLPAVPRALGAAEAPISRISGCERARWHIILMSVMSSVESNGCDQTPRPCFPENTRNRGFRLQGLEFAWFQNGDIRARGRWETPPPLLCTDASFPYLFLYGLCWAWLGLWRAEESSLQTKREPLWLHNLIVSKRFAPETFFAGFCSGFRTTET